MVFNLSNARVTELKVLEYCIAGFQEMLGKTMTGYGEKPWNVVQVAGNQQYRQQFLQSKKVEFPLIAVSLESIRPSSEDFGGFNGQVAYNGVHLGIIDETSPTPQQCILHFKQVSIDCRVMLTTQTLEHVLQFAQRWLFKDREMQFTLQTSIYNLNIKVILNQELSIPTEEFTEMGNLFVFEARATLMGFVGVTELKPVISKIVLSVDSINSENQYTDNIFVKTIGEAA